MNPEWCITVIPAKRQPALKDPLKQIRNSIRNPIGSVPLQDIISQKKKIDQICIVVSDATRPVPSQIILEAIISELKTYGITDNKILTLIATGLHRASYEDEIIRILGYNLKNRIKYVDHHAYNNEDLKFLGTLEDGTPIYINNLYYESDLKILTGYVEPHFFFGFSGGSKSIVPGIAGKSTIQANHSARNIDSPFSRFGIYKNNSMVKASAEIANLVGVDFIINVCINAKHEISNVAAGNLEAVHKELINYQLKYIFEEISEPFDIVISGNGGYPLDLNLYQAVKSMAIAEIAVKEGGTIISVNECSEGIGKGHDKFEELLFSNKSPSELYNKILQNEIVIPDQWEIQILARIMMKAEIYVVSSLNETELGNIGLKYANSIEDALHVSLLKHGKDAKVLMLPNGPQIIPKFK